MLRGKAFWRLGVGLAVCGLCLAATPVAAAPLIFPLGAGVAAIQAFLAPPPGGSFADRFRFACAEREICVVNERAGRDIEAEVTVVSGRVAFVGFRRQSRLSPLLPDPTDAVTRDVSTGLGVPVPMYDAHVPRCRYGACGWLYAGDVMLEDSDMRQGCTLFALATVDISQHPNAVHTVLLPWGTCWR